MNLLILSCGTRNLLVRYFKNTVSKQASGDNSVSGQVVCTKDTCEKSSIGQVVITDCSPLAPALYEADQFYIVPRMDSPDYLPTIFSICEQNQIDAVLPLQEDELTLVSNNKQAFQEKGVSAIVSEACALEICRDKFKFYCHLKKNQIPALATYETFDSFCRDYQEQKVAFPVFVKPIRGCGSIGAMKVPCMAVLEVLCKNSDTPLLIQEYCEGREYGADCYVDLLSHQVTHIFIKEKIRMRAGETEKSVTINNSELTSLVARTLKTLELSGPIDMDIFEKDGNFYISEINPRFGGGFPHAYACGLDVPQYIANNVAGITNEVCLERKYKELYVLKYSDVLVKEKD